MISDISDATDLIGSDRMWQYVAICGNYGAWIPVASQVTFCILFAKLQNESEQDQDRFAVVSFSTSPTGRCVKTVTDAQAPGGTRSVAHDSNSGIQ